MNVEVVDAQVAPVDANVLAQSATPASSSEVLEKPASSFTQGDDSSNCASDVVDHSNKVNLLGMTRKELETYFETIGEKKFRAAQVMKWIHQLGVTDFNEMTNLAGSLREKLSRL
ncbi:MAG TPA: hypothetical protein VIH30_03615, partial [Aquirhabdus sp.]